MILLGTLLRDQAIWKACIFMHWHTTLRTRTPKRAKKRRIETLPEFFIPLNSRNKCICQLYNEKLCYIELASHMGKIYFTCFIHLKNDAHFLIITWTQYTFHCMTLLLKASMKFLVSNNYKQLKHICSFNQITIHIGFIIGKVNSNNLINGPST